MKNISKKVQEFFIDSRIICNFVADFELTPVGVCKKI